MYSGGKGGSLPGIERKVRGVVWRKSGSLLGILGDRSGVQLGSKGEITTWYIMTKVRNVVRG